MPRRIESVSIAAIAAACVACGGLTHIPLGEGFDDGGAGGGSSTGSGGTMMPDGPIRTGRLDLIDDMEDGDERLPIPLRDGRSGHWATYNDGSPTVMQWPHPQGFYVMSAIDPPRGSSRYAARTYGSGLQSPMGWATIEMTFLASGPYDASAYSGLTFYARVGANTQTEVRLNVTTLQTLPQGGICKMCYDSFGKTLSLGTEWKQITLTFAELSQRGFGDPVASFDTAHVYTIDFGFAGPLPFDLWIDDIAFDEP
jgi:hypothetical protein